MHPRPLYAFIAGLTLAGVAFAAAPQIRKVNGSISVAAGSAFGDVSSVNGSIRLADNAIATRVKTVNGSITLGASASAESLRTVNGSIHVGAGGRVSDEVSAVNGAILLANKADVVGSLTNVNGRIVLDAAHVGDGIQTQNGNIEIGAGSRVEGGIHVKESRCKQGVLGWLSNCDDRILRVVIGPDVVVQGELEFEREVELYVSTRAKIGPVSGAQVILYSGARPSSLSMSF